jgi:hypothetical protein
MKMLRESFNKQKNIDEIHEDAKETLILEPQDSVDTD